MKKMEFLKQFVTVQSICTKENFCAEAGKK
mgnify:CR=1 FL=1